MAAPEQIDRALKATGRPDITGVPGNTTNKTVYVGPDGGLLDVPLPPFRKYAIAANGDVEFDANVTISTYGNSPMNASVYSGNNLKLHNTYSKVEGFGYYAGGVDAQRAAVTFGLRYNPMNLTGFHKAQKIAVPQFDAVAFEHLAICTSAATTSWIRPKPQ